MEKNNHFVLLVVGENPEERIKAFDPGSKEETHILYYKKDAKTIHENFIKQYEILLNNSDGKLTENVLNYISSELLYAKEISDEEFFVDLAEDYGETDENGNIITRGNPNAKYLFARPGGVFAIPFRLKDGKEAYSALKGDIDWEKIHLSQPAINTYTRVWEMCVEGDKPQNPTEEDMYNNLKERKDYFTNFANKDTYVSSNSAFWAYAILKEDDKWIDFGDVSISQFDWMSNFYDTFIKDLPDNTKLTIFECTR